MRDRDFIYLINRAVIIASKHALVQAELTKAFEDRYGCTYSDVDADQLIDLFDYQGGPAPTLVEVDEIMKEAIVRKDLNDGKRSR